jgi:hypothetical protein
MTETTEYAIAYIGGAKLLHPPAPKTGKPVPIGQWVAAQLATGAFVYRREIVVVTDWEQVTAP